MAAVWFGREKSRTGNSFFGLSASPISIKLAAKFSTLGEAEFPNYSVIIDLPVIYPV
jgi:hypothetical protein